MISPGKVIIFNNLFSMAIYGFCYNVVNILHVRITYFILKNVVVKLTICYTRIRKLITIMNHDNSNKIKLVIIHKINMCTQGINIYLVYTVL